MKVTVKLRNIHLSPRKLAALTPLFKNKPLAASIDKASLMSNKSAKSVWNLLKMAKSAANDKSLESDKLVISEIYANEGPRMKRMRPNARGRSNKFVRQLSHLTISVSEENKDEKKGTNGSKS